MTEDPAKAHGLTSLFSPVEQALDKVHEDRFSRLHHLATTELRYRPWLVQALDDLGISPGARNRSFEGEASQEDPFACFCGCWVGGDVHDASRIFAHRWFSSHQEGPWLVQRVLMSPPCGGSNTVAYNLLASHRKPAIRGLVDGRPYVGYGLPKGGLLWIGEETRDNVSVHLERTISDGALYEISGEVSHRGADAQWAAVSRSDWRYHRVDDAAFNKLLSR